MALVSADSRIAELLTELHQLIKQTQVRSRQPGRAFANFGHAGTQVTDGPGGEENVGCDRCIFLQRQDVLILSVP